jgi:hypothetical protein
MSEYWNDENDPNADGDFRDIPEETVENAIIPQPSIMPPPRAQAVQVVGQDAEYEEEYDEEYDTTADDDLQQNEVAEEDDYSNILDDARLRLEQGRLYEMVMKHNPFEHLDADPKAVIVVQKQIVKFAKEQMEIMLGMRQAKQQNFDSVVSSPFNDLEVKLLKEFASKMSGGKSAEAGANQVAQKLTSIGAPKQQRAPAPIPTSQPRAPQQALPQAPGQPLKRKKKVPGSIDRLLREGMSPKDVGYKPLKKSPNQMTTDELLQRNEEAKIRQASQKSARPANATPLPTYEQEEALHASRVNAANGTVSLIMKAIEMSKKK